MVAVVGTVTALVVMVNVPESPDVIVIFAGTDATAEGEAERVIRAPPAGAGPFKVSVAVTLVPPVTLIALNESDETLGSTVNRYGPELCVANLFAEST